MNDLFSPRMWRLIAVELHYTNLAFATGLLLVATTLLSIGMVAIPTPAEIDFFDGLLVGLALSIQWVAAHILGDTYRQEGRLSQHLLLPLTRRQIAFTRIFIPVLLMAVSLVCISVLIFIASFRGWLLSSSKMLLMSGGALTCLNQVYLLGRDQSLSGAGQQSGITVKALVFAALLIGLGVAALSEKMPFAFLFGPFTYLLVPAVIFFNFRWLSRPGDAV